MNIIIGVDNFWLGGRETFILEHVRALQRRKSSRFFLIGNSITSSLDPTIFAETIEFNDLNADTLCEKINQIFVAVKRIKPVCIWVHHYNILPFWQVASRCRIPLLVSFHGPLFSAGRPSSSSDVLGMTLALHRASRVTAVSDEILNEFAGFDLDRGRTCMLPNRVHLPDMPAVVADGRPVKLVMLTRMSKLGHIRATVVFFSLLRKRLPRARLFIHGGLRWDADSTSPAALSAIVRANAKILGRKWLLRHPRVLHSLGSVRFLPPAKDPFAAMQDAHLVLGMGRVVVEGIAARKPTVLVGYDDVIGLVSEETFYPYRASNFSGRGAGVTDTALLVEQVASAIDTQMTLSKTIRDEVDIERSCDDFIEIMELLETEAVREPTEEWRLNTANGPLSDNVTLDDDQALLNVIIAELDVKELQTWNSLSQVAVR